MTEQAHLTNLRQCERIAELHRFHSEQLIDTLKNDVYDFPPSDMHDKANAAVATLHEEYKVALRAMTNAKNDVEFIAGVWSDMLEIEQGVDTQNQKVLAELQAFRAAVTAWAFRERNANS